ncbi:MAG: type II secretion system protein GspD, partial [Venatoribacter sp.]
ALASNSKANMLSTPSIMTLDNQEAEIIVGQNVPFITGSTSSSTNTNPFTTISREDVGVTLKVKPHIHDGKAIRLEVEATSESVAPSSPTTAGSADLITNKRSLKTMILSGNEETIVLGGLIRDDVHEVESKVPFFGDIPLLGWLFKSKSSQQVKSNLMVFLRPTIVNDSGTVGTITKDKYDGIWEFTVSDKIGNNDDKNVTDLFKGLPVNR